MPPLPHLLIYERWQMILTATADLAASSLAFPPSPSLRVVAEDPHGSDRLGRELTGPAVARSNDYLAESPQTVVVSGDNLDYSKQLQPQQVRFCFSFLPKACRGAPDLPNTWPRAVSL